MIYFPYAGKSRFAYPPENCGTRSDTPALPDAITGIFLCPAPSFAYSLSTHSPVTTGTDSFYRIFYIFHCTIMTRPAFNN